MINRTFKNMLRQIIRQTKRGLVVFPLEQLEGITRPLLVFRLLININLKTEEIVDFVF